MMHSEDAPSAGALLEGSSAVISGSMKTEELYSAVAHLLDALKSANDTLTDDLEGAKRRLPIEEALRALIEFIDHLPIGNDLGLAFPLYELALGLAQLDAGSRPALFDHVPTKTGTPKNPPDREMRDIATAGFLQLLLKHGLSRTAAAEMLSAAYASGGVHSRNIEGVPVRFPAKRLKVWASRADSQKLRRFVSDRSELGSVSELLKAITLLARTWGQSSRRSEKV